MNIFTTLLGVFAGSLFIASMVLSFLGLDSEPRPSTLRVISIAEFFLAVSFILFLIRVLCLRKQKHCPTHKTKRHVLAALAFLGVYTVSNFLSIFVPILMSMHSICWGFVFPITAILTTWFLWLKQAGPKVLRFSFVAGFSIAYAGLSYFSIFVIPDIWAAC